MHRRFRAARAWPGRVAGFDEAGPAAPRGSAAALVDSQDALPPYAFGGQREFGRRRQRRPGGQRSGRAGVRRLGETAGRAGLYGRGRRSVPDPGVRALAGRDHAEPVAVFQTRNGEGGSMPSYAVASRGRRVGRRCLETSAPHRPRETRAKRRTVARQRPVVMFVDSVHLRRLRRSSRRQDALTTAPPPCASFSKVTHPPDLCNSVRASPSPAARRNAGLPQPFRQRSRKTGSVVAYGRSLPIPSHFYSRANCIAFRTGFPNPRTASGRGATTGSAAPRHSVAADGLARSRAGPRCGSVRARAAEPLSFSI